MTLNLQPSVHGVQSPRRRWLLAGAAAAGLAACSSGSARRDAAPADATTSTGVPPSRGNQAATQPPLALNPAAREEVVARAMLLINTPYTYGGNTPRGGFDCSGLVQYVIGQSLLDDTRTLRRLPRSTAQWARASLPRDIGQLQRGDLVFFNTSGTSFSHMGIYLGNRQFVHAPSSGGVVRTDRIDNSYFAPRFDGGRTVFL